MATTTTSKKQNKTAIDRKIHLYDAQGKVLGRLATDIARVLSGKGKVTFAPHIDNGDIVIVVNTDGVEVTGNKKDGKVYHRFSGYPGGITSVTFREQRKKDSTKLIWQAVYGMLPKNKLRARMLRRLHLIKGGEYKYKIDVTHE